MQNSKNKEDGGLIGKLFELNLYLLFLHRGYKNKYDFKLRREAEKAGKLDDVVFQYKIGHEWFIIFLQAKHDCTSAGKSIEDNTLFSKKFNLIKYLLSYRDIIKNYLNDVTIIKGFILYTNCPLGNNFTYDIEPITHVDVFDIDSRCAEQMQKFHLKKTPTIINKIKSEWELLMDNWKKDKRKERLYSQSAPQEDEIEKFLEHLTFAVNVPDHKKLRDIIKTEIGKKFGNLVREDIYNRAHQRMLDWMTGDDNRVFYEYNGAEALFKEITAGFSHGIRYLVDDPIKPFIGRADQLKNLHELLNNEKLVMINGLGGVGKTELVREYIKKHGQEYDDNILWIDAENVKTIEKSFRKLAACKLAIKTKDANGEEKDVAIVIQTVYEWFQQSKSLFIFDNAHWEQCSTYVQPSVSEGIEKPYFIITSRIKWENKIRTINLNVFTESEATDFISDQLPEFLNKEQQCDSVKKLAATLQYLPLGLTQAIAYINRKFMYQAKNYQISEYIENFSRNGKEYLNYNDSQYCGFGYTKTVWNTWDDSFEALQSKFIYTSDVLNYMSFLLSDNIHRDLLSKLIEEDKLDKVVPLLNEYSLINVEEKVYSIHRLVQLVTREKLERGKKLEVLIKILGVALENDEIVRRSIDHFTSAWTYFEEDCKNTIAQQVLA